jgi:hypothetical protein
MGHDSARLVRSQAAPRLSAQLRPLRDLEPTLIGKVIAGVWGIFYFFIFLGTFTSGPQPTAVGPCLWGAIYVVGWLAGFAVTMLIAHRPGIGALVVLASFLLWLVVEKYWPDTWYMVPALLLPGLLVLVSLAAIGLRKPPRDVI